MSYHSTEEYNYYGYFPNLGGNTFFSVYWALLTIIHILLAIPTKEVFFGVSFAIGCALEMIGYIGRALSHGNPYSLSYYMLPMVGTVIAPVFFMAGIYNSFGFIIEIFSRGYSSIKPINYRRIFIFLDVISLVIQAAGGGYADSLSSANKDASPGTHLMVAGLAFQVFTMSIFLGLVVAYYYKVYRATKTDLVRFDERYTEIRSSKKFQYLLYAFYFAIIMIYVRSIYRVIELAEGWNSSIMTHEDYFLILDGLMVSIAVLLLTIWYPGFSFVKMRKYNTVSDANTVPSESNEDDIEINNASLNEIK